jgi:cell wall-associated NlpC family hydrolase
MSIPLRVATTCATALALTMTPEIGEPNSAAAHEVALVQIHRKSQQKIQQKIRQRATLAMLQRKVRAQRAHIAARWQAKAGRAVRFAYRQRGKPYRWGGTGPHGYDCSGLVQRAWRAAGVAIPRVTHGQYRIRTHVPRRALHAGDLVFFHGLGHVGMYVGRGRFIHSPHTGSHVKVQRMSGHYRRAFVGAVRPAWRHLPRVPRHL